MEIVKAVKKLNPISRERLNFRRRPICKETLYKRATSMALMINQLFLWTSLCNFQTRCPSTTSIPRSKKVKNDQKLKSRGPALNIGASQCCRAHWMNFSHLGVGNTADHRNYRKLKLNRNFAKLQLVYSNPGDFDKRLNFVLFKNVKLAEDFFSFWMRDCTADLGRECLESAVTLILYDMEEFHNYTKKLFAYEI